MEQARKMFETMLTASGKSAPIWDGRKYTTKNVQTYWRWFWLGYSMSGK